MFTITSMVGFNFFGGVELLHQKLVSTIWRFFQAAWNHQVDNH